MVDEAEHRAALNYISRLEKEISILKVEAKRSISRSVTPSAPRSATPVSKVVIDKEIQILKDRVAFLEETNNTLLRDMNRRTDNYVKEVMRLTGRKPNSLKDASFSASPIIKSELSEVSTQTSVPPLQDASNDPEFFYIDSYIQTDSFSLELTDNETQINIESTELANFETQTSEICLAIACTETDEPENTLVNNETQHEDEAKTEYSNGISQTGTIDLCDQSIIAVEEPISKTDVSTETNLQGLYNSTFTSTSEHITVINSSIQTDTPDHSIDELLNKIDSLSTMNDSLRSANNNYANELDEVERKAREEVVSLQHRLSIVEESERKLKIRLMHSRGVAPETSRNY